MMLHHPFTDVKDLTVEKFHLQRRMTSHRHEPDYPPEDAKDSDDDRFEDPGIYNEEDAVQNWEPLDAYNDAG
jgi:hypothetical protein